MDLALGLPAASAAAALLGLLIGSFLNVVAHRLPRMMERGWRAECREALGLEAEPQERFDLVAPRSRCPECARPVAALENIPVLSYLVLRGRCRGCGTRISIQYPLVELTAGVLAGVVVWQLGADWQAAAALALTWSLLVLAVIDFRTQLLPDSITLPLLWLGLLVNLQGLFVPIEDAVIGAAAGYLSLWGVYHVFRLITGKEGMGYGDFKLLAALGAWLGWQALPTIILLSAAVGAVLGLLLIVARGRDRSQPIPYGPFLAAAGWIALLWGEPLADWYLRAAGLA